MAGGGLACQTTTRIVFAGQEQCAAVALGQLTLFDQPKRLVRQLKQSDQVRDGHATSAHAQSHLFAGEAQLIDERRAAARFVDGVEVLARHVLDQRHLERCCVVLVADDGRHGSELGHLGSAPAALARDQLVAPADNRPHEHRLEHAAGSDRLSESEQPLLVEAASWLRWIRRDQLNGQLAELFLLVTGDNREDRG
jgi:hypothetical protein